MCIRDSWNASRYDYYNDPYYYTSSNYRYGYGGNWYNTCLLYTSRCV